MEDNKLQTFDQSTRLKWVDKIAQLMDSKFLIPGTKIRFGLDPIISLFPVVGDLVSYIISGVLINTMYRKGASQKLVVKMVINATIDLIIGSIPLLGSIFDVFYKSNTKNVQLLKEYYEEGKHQGSGKGLITLALAIVFIIIAGLVFLIWVVIAELFDFIF